MKVSFLSRIVYVLTASLVAFSFTACNRWKDKTAQEKAEYITDKASHKLELTEQQEAKLETFLVAFIAFGDDFKSTFYKNSDTFSQLFLLPKIQDKDLTALIGDQYNSVLKHREEINRLFIDFHSSLNTEQKQTVNAWIAKKLKHYKNS